MMKRKVAMLLAAVLCLLAAGMTGCSKEKGTEEKFNQYIEFNNVVAGVLNRQVTQYFDCFGKGLEPDIPKDFGGIATQAMTDEEYKQLDDIIKLASSEPIMSGLDEAASELAKSSKELYQLVDEVSAYYGNGEYKDDQMARSGDIHTRYLALSEQYEQVFDRFSDKMDEEDLMRMQNMLESFQKKGDYYHYYATKTLLDGQAILNYFEEKEITDDNLLSVNKDGYKILYNQIVQDALMFQSEAGKANSGEMRRLMEQKIFGVGVVADHIQMMLEAGSMDIEIPGITDTGAAAAGEYKPVENLEYMLHTAISDYNTYGAVQ
ncbi:DUF3829 domain-containing protein [Anaerolentibacter hominis]|uniref:DUF3829 domain-containing protein n=1 Tax=Anaerolentibacter hominis TaxID=3079009 RepID=UPI0031B83B74